MRKERNEKAFQDWLEIKEKNDETIKKKLELKMKLKKKKSFEK